METPVYDTQSCWSDPGQHAAWLAAIPPEPEAIVHHVSGLVTHCLAARLQGTPIPEGARRDCEIRTAANLLDRIVARDSRPPSVPRAPAARFFGVCAHFALLATAVLRGHGVPARTRVGFARYFVPDSFEDHVVTEYWDGGRWRLLDAELDDATRTLFGIGFSPADVPRDQFLDASTAWRDLRAGAIDPARIGLTAVGLTGAWFPAQSVLRDAAALNKEEPLCWDTWGAGRQVGPYTPAVPAPFATDLDAVAGALAGSPSADLAARIYHATPWLRRTPTIFTLAFPAGWPDGVPTELALPVSPTCP